MERYKIIFIAIVLVSCSIKDENSQEVSVETISKGELYGIEEEAGLTNNYIITNQEQWDIFLNKINSVNQNVEEESIDFSKFIVLGVIDTFRAYSGYSVEILNVSKKKNNLEIEVQYKNEKGIIPVENQPYHIVKIARS